MRISDSMRYRLLQANITKVAEQLNSIQTKISTQKEINVPSDDPIKFAAAIQYDAERAIGSQFNETLTRLNTFVGMYDTCFSTVSSQLSGIKSLAINYGSMDSELQDAASEQIKNVIEQLVTVANTKIGSTYIFGGEQADSAPFHLNSDYSVTYNVSQQAEDASDVYVDKGQLASFGISGRQAFYGTDKIALGDVSNSYTGDIYSNTDYFSYVIDTSNNKINTIDADGNTTTLELSSGVYTGASLAKEIQKQLNDPDGSGDPTDDFVVAFDSSTRKFLITNNSGEDVTFDWSASSAANDLGFNKDSVDGVKTVASGQIMESDYDSGRRSFMVKITTGGSTTGELDSRAKYRYSIDGGANWLPPTDTGLTVNVNTGGADSTADITIGGSNKGLHVTFDGVDTVVELNEETYTGAGLADAIESAFEVKGINGMQVTYSADTRKFTITNQSGKVVTIDWSDPQSTVAGVLGFGTTESVLNNGNSDTSDYIAGMFIDGSGIANTTNNGIKLVFQTRATDNIVINDTGSQNNELSVTYGSTSALVSLDAGTYTGSDLAKEIETQLEDAFGGEFQVSYDYNTKKFTITNQSDEELTIDWSDSTAAGGLGFSGITDLNQGEYDTGDSAAQLLDGSNLSVNDSFQVKDLSIFELLKDFKDACDSGNSAWISKNAGLLDQVSALTTKNNAVIAFQGTQANTLISNNKTKDAQLESMKSKLVDASMADLATEFNILLNTYQALLSTLAQMQSISILDYLK